MTGSNDFLAATSSLERGYRGINRFYGALSQPYSLENQNSPITVIKDATGELRVVPANCVSKTSRFSSKDISWKTIVPLE